MTDQVRGLIEKEIISGWYSIRSGGRSLLRRRHCGFCDPAGRRHRGPGQHVRGVHRPHGQRQFHGRRRLGVHNLPHERRRALGRFRQRPKRGDVWLGTQSQTAHVRLPVARGHDGDGRHADDSNGCIPRRHHGGGPVHQPHVQHRARRGLLLRFIQRRRGRELDACGSVRSAPRPPNHRRRALPQPGAISAQSSVQRRDVLLRAERIPRRLRAERRRWNQLHHGRADPEHPRQRSDRSESDRCRERGPVLGIDRPRSRRTRRHRVRATQGLRRHIHHSGGDEHGVAGGHPGAYSDRKQRRAVDHPQGPSCPSA